MIKLNSLQGEPFYLNAELIERIEETPDTMITLIGGKKVRVSQEGKEVVELIITYRRRIAGGSLEVVK